MVRGEGMVHVYTGDGKGKTTAAIGLAVRAAGRGLKVVMIQFMKGQVTYGELLPLKKLGIEVRQFGRPDFVNPGNPDPLDVRMAQDALDFAEEVIREGEHDMVILDEINVAAAWGLVDVRRCQDIIRSRPPHVEVVLTGRYAPDEFIDLADLVTEMKEVKHYYRKGISAREGIEC